MKVLLVLNATSITGALKSILKTAADLQHEHHFLLAIPQQSSIGDYLSAQNFNYIRLPFVEISRNHQRNLLYLPALLRNAYRLAKIVEQNNIQIVHSNDLFNLVPLVAKLFNRNFKAVVHIRRMPDSFPLRLYKVWVNLLLRYADAIIPVSRANARIFNASPKVQVVYNRYPEAEKHPPYQVKSLGEKTAKNPSSIQLLYLANFTPGKGQNHAIAAMKLLLEQQSNLTIQLTFIGGDLGLAKNQQLKKNLAEQVGNEGLEKYIQFKEKVSDVEAAMKQYDIVLNLSDSESFSRVSMEALFYGLPLIATDVGGTREMFDDGISGRLVPRADVQAMCAAILELVEDEQLRKQFSEAAYTRIRKEFDKEATSFKIGRLYKRLQW